MVERMTMDSIYAWLRFIHLVAAFTFILGHGTSIAFAFQLKKEKDPVRVEAMFALSGSMWMVYMISLLVLLVDGIVLSFIGQWWSFGWVWLSLALLLGITVWMFHLGTSTYSAVRKAFGLPYREKNVNHEAEPPLSEEERAKLVASTNPRLMLLVGYGGFLLIAWLMMFKPF